MKISQFAYARRLVSGRAMPGAVFASLFTLSLSATAQEPPAATPPAAAPPAATPPAAAPPAATPPTTEAPAAKAPAADKEAGTDPAAEGEPAEAPEEAEPEAPVEEEAPEPAPVQTDAEITAEVEAAPEPKGLAVGESPEEEEEDAEYDKSRPVMDIERLHAEAYPNDPLPGIRGGSMELVINRLQWPYMPAKKGGPDLVIGFSGDAWVDSNIRQIKAGLDTEDDQTEYRQQGRLRLRVTPTYNRPNGWFAQTNIEFVANADQDHTVTRYVDVDEAWIRVGKWKTFDIQVGRMQGFEVYHYGMGLDLNTYERQGAVSFSQTPAQPYGVSDLWDRGINSGAVAAHWYGPKWLRLEMLTRFGLSGQGNDVGIRPVGVLDLGWMKFKAGYERRLRESLFNNSDARIETQGLGGSLQFVFDPWVEFGGNIAHRIEDAFEADGAARPGASSNTTTAGGYLNVRPYFKQWMVGLGYNYTYWENFQYDAFYERENSSHKQMFGAVQYMLWDKLYIKYVLAYANGHIENRNDSDINDTGFNNESLSHRLRLMMLY